MIHIEIKDDYTQTTRYYGSANDDLSSLPVKKVEGKIKDFVSKWLFDKPKKEEEENGIV